MGLPVYPNMDRMRLKINRDTHGVSLDSAHARFGANVASDFGSRTFLL